MTMLRSGAGGLPMVALRSADGATADVYLHGAHVASWRPAPGVDERLFLSSRSAFGEHAAIRGGIPVIFPQFAAEGPLPRHGFARTSAWTLVSTEDLPDGGALATLTLSDSPETRAIWPAEFLASLSVSVSGARLEVALAVENRGRTGFEFTCALHTYLRVASIADVGVDGLAGFRYRDDRDRGAGRSPAFPSTALLVDEAESLRITGEVDRVYVDAPRAVTLREPQRALGISARGFPDLVLWNPGPEKAAALKDMEANGERTMLCVEAAAVQVPIALAAGARWQGSQTLDASVG